MPIAGDLRAADALISIEGCRCMVEIITRLADFQGQLRAARIKLRDLGLLLTALTDAFPVGTKVALARFGAGLDPGGDALILL